ncbi:unnamed protein product [Orchesella dallaii]|uniref:Fucosyltransferase n=1 Tax=Orchesella dallaii TaxID=48710 RepID=A0ABP1RVQ8_9HEXA
MSTTTNSFQFLIKVILLGIFWVLGFIYIYSSKDLYEYKKLVWVNEASDKVLILFWTSYFGSKNKDPLSAMGINIAAYPPECFRNCEFTFNRSRITEAHVIVFHSRDLNKLDMPKFRSVTQIWVWMEQESPIQAPKDLELFSGVFNWTMTYRNDSDVVHPYGKIVPIETSPKNKSELNAFLVGKQKVAAAVISNCHTNSKREVLIKKLKQEGISIDTFGNCGIPICPRGPRVLRNGQNCTESEFWENLAKDYKFYLSFENALCKDYATEKLFRTLELGLVPVVYGGADYQRIAPPNSFIDVESFETLSHFAEFLNNLNRNEEEYKKYFEWKENFKVGRGGGWCTLCDKVRKHNLNRKGGKHHVPKVYKDLKDWWLHYTVDGDMKPACRKPLEYL